MYQTKPKTTILIIFNSEFEIDNKTMCFTCKLTQRNSYDDYAVQKALRVFTSDQRATSRCAQNGGAFS